MPYTAGSVLQCFCHLLIQEYHISLNLQSIFPKKWVNLFLSPFEKYPFYAFLGTYVTDFVFLPRLTHFFSFFQPPQYLSSFPQNSSLLTGPNRRESNELSRLSPIKKYSSSPSRSMDISSSISHSETYGSSIASPLI